MAERTISEVDKLVASLHAMANIEHCHGQKIGMSLSYSSEEASNLLREIKLLRRDTKLSCGIVGSDVILKGPGGKIVLHTFKLGDTQQVEDKQ